MAPAGYATSVTFTKTIPGISALAIVSVALSCLDSSAPLFTSPPISKPWPNEPPNYVLISDYGFDDSIQATPNDAPLGRSNWWVQWNPVGNGSRAADGAAPVSPPFVYQVKYPIGFLSGLAPSTLEYYLRSPFARELYWGFWWKPSKPFQSDGSGVNKIVFIWTQSSLGIYPDLLYFALVPGPWHIRCQNNLGAGAGPSAGQHLEPNVDTTIVTLGDWHRIEILAKYSSGDSANGVLQWWVDGQLNGAYANLKMVQDSGFRYLEFAPTYGGNTGDHKLQTDYYWFDHTHVSRAP